ncbi:MAG: sulfotransferase family protein [Sphingomonadaceae bacterium]
MTTGAERIGLLDLRAEVHLRAGSPALAFADWDARNRLIADGAALPPGLERAGDRARRVADWLDGLDSFPTHPPAPSTPVLLVGFPRSGTTLLEKALAGHPAIRVLEEEPHLEAVAGPLLAPGTIARLPDLPETAVEPLRARYGAAAGLGRESILIDKMPLSTVLLPAIARLYPDARILLALRDPRDVVLGVFRRRFRLNSAMVDMLELERAAAFYDSVMRIARAAETRLPLRIHRVVHERLIADFDGEVGSALAFLGLNWDENVRDFAARATVRARTPSDLQLREGLSAEGVGSWRAFRRELAPVLPKLNAWAERFGYPPD